MHYYVNILEMIGDTPLVKLNFLVEKTEALVLAKLESCNPGRSIKDRIAIHLIEDAEKKGLLKKNGTIIERTSGNTGVGLALGALIKGYKLLCLVPDKISQEKLNTLKALGAKTVICPSNLDPSDPNSYYSLPKKLVQEIPDAWYVNQYDNIINTKVHYQYTGPEIWKQTSGKVTHCVMGVGTGGTITGVGKFLKEKKPSIKIWGIDSYGSLLKKYHETGLVDKNESYPYLIEGIGENSLIPKNIDFSVIDGFVKVSDQDAVLYARKLAVEEGLLMGYSSGAVVQGILQLREHFTSNDVVVTIFPDHGTAYLSKVFNDDWVKQKFNNHCDILS